MRLKLTPFVGLATSLFIGWLTPIHAIAQCTGVCGDANNSGAVTSADFIYLTNFLYNGGPVANPDCADLDGYDIITLRDVTYVNRYTFAAGPAPICPTPNPALVPPVSQDFAIEHTGAVPAGDTLVSILFRIRNAVLVRGVSLAFVIDIDGETPIIDTIIKGDIDGSVFLSYAIEPPGAPPASVAAGFHAPAGNLSPGSTDLMTVVARVSPASCPRLISVNWTALPPIMNDMNGVPTPVNYLMIMDQDNGFWAPEPAACPILYTGDVNMDLVVTSADIIFAVAYLFKGYCDPMPCPGSADVNCSNTVTSSDVIYMVNHIFKGGPLPCDVCAEIPGTWSCL